MICNFLNGEETSRSLDNLEVSIPVSLPLNDIDEPTIRIRLNHIHQNLLATPDFTNIPFCLHCKRTVDADDPFVRSGYQEGIGVDVDMPDIT